MAEQFLKIKIGARGVYTLTLYRPETANALDGVLVGELLQTLAQVQAEPSVRVVVLTGDGDVFSSGADLAWMEQMAGADFATNLADAAELAKVYETLAGLKVPTLARVNGPAYGGAIGLIAACDIAIASSSACFAFRETRLGLAPAVIAPYVVAAIGQRQARRWIFSGDDFDAEIAQRLGLVHAVVSLEELDDAVEREIARLLLGGPGALAETKALLTRLSNVGLPAPTELAERLAKLRAAPEGREGIRAFLERHKPGWQS